MILIETIKLYLQTDSNTMWQKLNRGEWPLLLIKFKVSTTPTSEFADFGSIKKSKIEEIKGDLIRLNIFDRIVFQGIDYLTW